MIETLENTRHGRPIKQQMNLSIDHLIEMQH